MSPQAKRKKGKVQYVWRFDKTKYKAVYAQFEQILMKISPIIDINYKTLVKVILNHKIILSRGLLPYLDGTYSAWLNYLVFLRVKISDIFNRCFSFLPFKHDACTHLCCVLSKAE